MAALGIDPDTVSWELRMTVPSSIFELQQIEVMNAQAGLMSTMSEWFDDEWLLKHVLHFSSDDASKIVSNNESEQERKMDNAARVESILKKKYPGFSMDANEKPVQEDVDLRVKFDKLAEQVKETRQSSGAMLKRIEKLVPSRHEMRRLANSRR
jgi:hypothetical protein